MGEYDIELIVIEGLDASGKNTQAYLLANFLLDKGKIICIRIHPSNDNAFGAITKRFLQTNSKIAHFGSAIFYILDVVHSIMKYCREDYDYLLFVRYLLGTAYLPPPIDRITYQFFSALLPKPELTIFIDVEPETALKRIALRPYSAPEIFETIDSLREIRRKGLIMALFAKWHIINGNRSVNEIELEIRNLFNNIKAT